MRLLVLSSYFKGNRFLERMHAEGCAVDLLTIQAALGEPWSRHAVRDVFAVPNFHDRKALVNAVAYLFRTNNYERIVALDDFDIEVAAYLREQFRMTDTGHGDSEARFFRDKLAMRMKARELGLTIPRFTSTFRNDDVNRFLAEVPGPWLIKPRSEASAAGIRKLHSVDEAWQRLDALGDDRSNQLIEEMVPGDLFHVDSLTCEGKVIFAEVNRYHKPLLDVYQGGGIYATRTLRLDSPDVAALKEANRAVVEGFGLKQGASHTEFMKAHRDGKFYFIETSARVGGAYTAEMVEQATGINPWSEWAKLELCRTAGPYSLPQTRRRYAAVIISLARQERPDTAGFTDPEIAHRLDMKNHIGFVLASDDYDRLTHLLDSYRERIARDFHAVLPGAEKVGH